MSVAVVIPFFQEKPGLLRRALYSVGAQAGVARARVVVVDDGSPVDVAGEIADLPKFQTELEIEVLRQPNGGPAKARNRGLDALDSTIRRVAFLDSDDAWRPHHLRSALAVFDAGFDAFFADFFQPGQTVGAFKRAGLVDTSTHPTVADDPSLHAFAGDMFDQVISRNLIGTSTVAYAFDQFRNQRFDEAFRSAGEDYLFWIDLARKGARFAFSSDIDVDYGYGVNIYGGSGWGTDGFLRRVHDEMRYRKRLLSYALDPTQRALVHRKIRGLRREFALGALFSIIRRRPLDVGLMRAQWRLDPRSIFAIPLEAGSVAADKIRGRTARESGHA